jgi:glycosyltransferase involved in cell wall biosynthesis
MRVLTILHEGTLTGAPLAGLRTAKVFAEFALSDVWAGDRVSEAFSEYATMHTGREILNGPINLRNYDLYVCHSAASAPLVSRLIDEKVKVIWWIHEESHFFDVLPPRVINKCLLGASALVFVSSFCAFQTFAYWTWKRHAKSVYIIPNFVPDITVREFRRLGALKTKRSSILRVIHIGTLGHLKGSDIVIETAKACLMSSVASEFLLVGRVLEEQLQKNLPANVKLTGELPSDKVYEHIAESDYLIHPSRLDNQPLVVLEALAGGVRTICSSLPSLREYITPNHGATFLENVNPKSSFQIRDILESVATDRVVFPKAFSESTFSSSVKRMLTLEHLI